MILARRAFLAGTALPALALALGSPALAQSFQGTPNIVTGSGSVTTAPGFTQIDVFAAENVINWTAPDLTSAGAIDFQPAGTTALFTNASNFADYTVLNRILPMDANGKAIASTVTFNGTVQSVNGQLPGGNIWFYTPTGIILSPTAKFTVGSLILTTNDIQFTPNSFIANGSGGTFGTVYGPGGSIQFRGPNNPAGLVRIQAGASVTATGGTPYVAMVAPRVEQHGAVQSNGSVAYIAAEELDLTINAGLFDIALITGSDDANGVVHSGTTTGPASTGLANAKRISMVALPKNTALTMLLSGTVGYTPAAVATNDGSSIVLSAGFDRDVPTSLPSNRSGNIAIGPAVFTNPLQAYASNAITVAPSGGTTDFQGDVSLAALKSVTLAAKASDSIRAPNLSLYSGEPGTGGQIDVMTTGKGSIAAALALNVNATSDAFPVSFGGPLDGTGGAVTMTANGGTISSSNMFVDAGGAGGFGDSVGGDGKGGSVALSVSSGGTISSGFTLLAADGSGGSSAGQGGAGTGGTISLKDTGGSFDFATVLLSAAGSGGGGDAAGGDGLGGAISVALGGQAQDWDQLLIDASASGGLGTAPLASGGNALGRSDAISLAISGPASLNVVGSVTLAADSLASIDGAPGFSGQAGGITASVTAGGRLSVGGMIDAHASALPASFREVSLPATRSALQRGGAVSVTASGGSITASNLLVAADAFGVSGATFGGDAVGGTVRVTSDNGGSITLDDGAGTARLTLTANAFGQAGAAPSDARGGTAQLLANNGTISTTGNALIEAAASSEVTADPPANGPGYSATGGNALVQIATGTGSISSRTLTIGADGDARSRVDPGTGAIVVATSGNGGAGGGGAASLLQAGGTLTTNSLTVGANGNGGYSAAAGGSGIGGSAAVSLSGGQASAGPVQIAAIGTGGAGAPGGVGSGGNASFILADSIGPVGARNVASLNIDASGVGGANAAGGVAPSDGGAATFTVAPISSAGALLLPGNLTITAQGSRPAAGTGIAINIAGVPLTVGGNISLSTVRDATIAAPQPLTANGSVTILARTLTETGLLASGGPLSVSTSGAISAAGLASAATTLLQSASGPVTVTSLTSAGPVTAGGTTVTLSSPGSLAIDDLIASSGAAQVMAAGALTVAQASAAGNLLLQAGTALTLTGPASGANVALTANGPVTVNGNITSPGSLTVTSGGLFSASAFLVARDITATSSDIALGATARLGALGKTSTVTLINGAPGEITRVGDGNSYGLSAAELNRLYADAAITVRANTAGMIVDTVVMDMTHLGPSGSLRLVSPTSLDVIGNAAFNGAVAGQSVSLTGTTVTVHTDAGALGIADSAGAATGTLGLNGDKVIIASNAALADSALSSSVAASSARLGVADVQRPYTFRAGTIAVTAGSLFYVQNSGSSSAFPDRRGFLANALNINTSSPATRIAINGQIAMPGGLVSGLLAVPLVTINGARAAGGGRFEPGSTINGCIIGANCSAGSVFSPDPSLNLERPLPVGSTSPTFVAALVETSPRHERPDAPLIDEPITGVGNDDLWQPQCQRDDKRPAKCRTETEQQ